jgi:release factor glutamine methyltransferase
VSLHCTWRDIMRDAAERLTAAGVPGAARDARLLLAHALGITPVDIIVREMDAIDGAVLIDFEAAVARRLVGEPVSRIRGWRDFYGRRFAISPDVLDPRPETELLVEAGVARLPQGGRVLDLGTGSGCILVSVLAERPDASGVGVDLSAAALAMAARNAAALGVADRATFVEGGWEAGAGPVDLVLSNPPYITEAEFDDLDVDVRGHDPKLALVGGVDGLAPYRDIVPLARGWLGPGGWLGVEFGATQAAAVTALMAEGGFADVEVMHDLAGHARAAFGRRVVNG